MRLIYSSNDRSFRGKVMHNFLAPFYQCTEVHPPNWIIIYTAKGGIYKPVLSNNSIKVIIRIHAILQFQMFSIQERAKKGAWDILDTSRQKYTATRY